MTIPQTLTVTLNQNVSLDVETGQRICDGVKATSKFRDRKHGRPTPKMPSPISPASPAHLRPVNLLLELGLAMLPPQHHGHNLAPLHWTLIRYGYLFDRPTSSGRLRTNHLVGDYRNHHMTALSEALGVGCALTSARSWLAQTCSSNVKIHDPIDFDYLIGKSPTRLQGQAYAITAATIPTAGKKTRSRQPDYLFAAEDQNGKVQLLVVECKGTCGSRSTSLGQLGSAMHQLEGITFNTSTVGQVAIDRHAYATNVSKAGAEVRVFGVDPPGQGERWLVPTRETKTRYFSPELDERTGSISLPSPEVVAGQALRRLPERALEWSGVRDDRDDNLKSTFESEVGDVTGTRSTVELPDGSSLSVFTGALRSVLEESRRVVNGDLDASSFREIEEGAAVPDGKPRPFRTLSHGRGNDETLASSLTEDGLVLEISVD